ncbi:hypothetical protein ACFWD7_23765 [Streptomyces mirabilis]|uniref:hypothetical protein n=1 Tax=Streptomyces mirabilis TaxID=68239 RepID=UPI00369F998B
MTPRHPSRVRTQAAAALTTVLLTGAITAGLHHPGHLMRLLAVLAAVLGALTATLALAAAFAPTATTRTAARTTLDLLLRLVPWYKS